MSKPDECPISNAMSCIALHPRDWSSDHRDAWLYGIIVGWDDESLAELKGDHKWDDASVARLKRLRASFIALAEKAPSDAR